MPEHGCQSSCVERCLTLGSQAAVQHLPVGGTGTKALVRGPLSAGRRTSRSVTVVLRPLPFVAVFVFVVVHVVVVVS